MNLQAFVSLASLFAPLISSSVTFRVTYKDCTRQWMVAGDPVGKKNLPIDRNMGKTRAPCLQEWQASSQERSSVVGWETGFIRERRGGRVQVGRGDPQLPLPGHLDLVSLLGTPVL